ncbi:ATP-dependent DNA helicase [Entomospira nematocerorum]|uniref:ATP-dependent DNA helicase n=1 Tax=Entomospira nematocerorum TaxID=2719987 RepID=A0A968KSZ3_9SPIO|nr:ATP-dependent DNA helicase [Entomospira nematocera]NIZ46906.1 ATP-dependent DNA helicase [Entomospira nematocera]WDI33296.1 ATP-dependent DNA helicase [Entomospira nematocera]
MSQLIPEDLAESILGHEGIFSQKLPNYELREGQLALMEQVVSAFNDSTILVAEAGTGIGKSFAYLIPAVYWALCNQERIVISTATITLQEQLVRKDVPTVLRLLKQDVRVELAKGRQNYLCWKRFEEVIVEEQAMLVSMSTNLDAVNEWAQQTTTGDKAELDMSLEEGIWQKINCESDSCLGKSCPAYDRCFLNIVRKRLEEAHIIIANHHLVFADLKLRQLSSEVVRILPSYTRLIFDEAHNVLHSATSFFSSQMTHYSVNRLLLRFYRRRAQDSYGLLPQVEYFFHKDTTQKRDIDKAYRLLEQCRDAGQNLTTKSSLHIEESFRLHTAVVPSFLEEGVLLPLQHLSSMLKQFYNHVKVLADAVKCESDANLPLVVELKQALQRVREMADLAESFLHYMDDEGAVYWGERRKTAMQEEYVRLEVTPLDLAVQMRSLVYEAHETVIMVSATLNIGDDFHYFKQNLGFYGYNDRVVSFHSYASPFDYRNVSLLGLPIDGPSPERSSFDRYVEEFLTRIFAGSKGRGLALFTSYRAMQGAYDTLKERLTADGIEVLVQGEMGKHQLIRRFEEHGSAVLLATDSFWEGVDINNQYLKIVALCRLPFTPPNSPIAQAKSEAIEREGYSPFMQLQIPEAAIKLKQGFGRLIRKQNDFGVVYILDNRIKTKAYGKLLLQALPPARQLSGASQWLIDEGLLFLNEQERCNKEWEE